MAFSFCETAGSNVSTHSSQLDSLQATANPELTSSHSNSNSNSAINDATVNSLDSYSYPTHHDLPLPPLHHYQYSHRDYLGRHDQTYRGDNQSYTRHASITSNFNDARNINSNISSIPLMQHSPNNEKFRKSNPTHPYNDSRPYIPDNQRFATPHSYTHNDANMFSYSDTNRSNEYNLSRKPNGFNDYRNPHTFFPSQPDNRSVLNFNYPENIHFNPHLNAESNINSSPNDYTCPMTRFSSLADPDIFSKEHQLNYNLHTTRKIIESSSDPLLNQTFKIIKIHMQSLFMTIANLYPSLSYHELLHLLYASYFLPEQRYFNPQFVSQDSCLYDPFTYPSHIEEESLRVGLSSMAVMAERKFPRLSQAVLKGLNNTVPSEQYKTSEQNQSPREQRNSQGSVHLSSPEHSLDSNRNSAGNTNSHTAVETQQQPYLDDPNQDLRSIPAPFSSEHRIPSGPLQNQPNLSRFDGVPRFDRNYIQPLQREKRQQSNLNNFETASQGLESLQKNVLPVSAQHGASDHENERRLSKQVETLSVSNSNTPDSSSESLVLPDTNGKQHPDIHSPLIHSQNDQSAISNFDTNKDVADSFNSGSSTENSTRKSFENAHSRNSPSTCGNVNSRTGSVVEPLEHINKSSSMATLHANSLGNNNTLLRRDFTYDDNSQDFASGMLLAYPDQPSSLPLSSSSNTLSNIEATSVPHSDVNKNNFRDLNLEFSLQMAHGNESPNSRNSENSSEHMDEESFQLSIPVSMSRSQQMSLSPTNSQGSSLIHKQDKNRYPTILSSPKFSLGRLGNTADNERRTSSHFLSTSIFQDESDSRVGATFEKSDRANPTQGAISNSRQINSELEPIFGTGQADTAISDDDSLQYQDADESFPSRIDILAKMTPSIAVKDPSARQEAFMDRDSDIASDDEYILNSSGPIGVKTIKTVPIVLTRKGGLNTRHYSTIQQDDAIGVPSLGSYVDNSASGSHEYAGSTGPVSRTFSPHYPSQSRDNDSNSGLKEMSVFSASPSSLLHLSSKDLQKLTLSPEYDAGKSQNIEFGFHEIPGLVPSPSVPTLSAASELYLSQGGAYPPIELMDHSTAMSLDQLQQQKEMHEGRAETQPRYQDVDANVFEGPMRFTTREQLNSGSRNKALRMVDSSFRQCGEILTTSDRDDFHNGDSGVMMRHEISFISPASIYSPVPVRSMAIVDDCAEPQQGRKPANTNIAVSLARHEEHQLSPGQLPDSRKEITRRAEKSTGYNELAGLAINDIGGESSTTTKVHNDKRRNVFMQPGSPFFPSSPFVQASPTFPVHFNRHATNNSALHLARGPLSGPFSHMQANGSTRSISEGSIRSTPSLGSLSSGNPVSQRIKDVVNSLFGNAGSGNKSKGSYKRDGGRTGDRANAEPRRNVMDRVNSINSNASLESVASIGNNV